MEERVKVYYKNKPSEEVKIVYACNDPKKDDEVIFKSHGYFYSYFRNSCNFYVNDKRLVEGGKNWTGECPISDFGYMPLPFGYSSFEDFVEKDDDMKYIWKKPEGMTEEGSVYKIPCAPTISDWAKECLDNRKNNEESRKPDLIDALMLGAKMMEELEEKNTPCDPSSDPTHPSHYAQGGISVWDVIKAYTDGLNGVDAFNAGNAIKYILRWRHKNGVEDLKKAKVYIDELIKSQKEKKNENCG